MPKRVAALSAKALAAVQASDKPVELVDGLVPGLRLRVLPSGTRTWSLNIRDGKGVRRRFDVGAGLGLAEARRKAEELRRAIRAGADPTAERRAARQRSQAAREGIGTLAAVIDAYFLNGPGAQRRRAARNRRLLLTVFAKIATRPALDLDASDLQLIVDGWRSKATAALAVRVLRPCLRWAQKRKLARPGVAELEPLGSVGRRDRVLSRPELALIWHSLQGTHGDVIKWLLWRGCRLSEATGLRWGEIDGDLWTIPSERTKNGRQRTIPLPSQAVELLCAIGSNKPVMSSQRIELLRSLRSNAAEALVFPSRRGGVLSNWDRETKRLQSASATKGWHRHDLRRTVATMLGDLGFAPHVAGVVLGHAHTADGATAIYARSRYQRDHREALQAVADEIDLCTGGSNVIRLPAG